MSEMQYADAHSQLNHNHPTSEEVAQLAYDRYLARGRQDGFDLDDWLAAEAEARQRRAAALATSSSIGSPEPPEPIGSPEPTAAAPPKRRRTSAKPVVPARRRAKDRSS